MKLASTLLSLVCILFVGCVPFKVQIGRHTDGTVVSQGTRKPIAGAEVMYKGHSITKVLTGEDGRFVLEQATVTKWLVPIPADYFGWRWHPLRVRAAGYRAVTFEQPSQEPAAPLLIELPPSR
jgi:hypothetical protein